MAPSIFKRSSGGKETVDIETAYNIWNLLKSRYNSVETYQTFRNFIHDRDFAIMANLAVDEFEKQVRLFEAEALKFQINLPSRPPVDFKTSTNLDELSDSSIYRRLQSDLLAEVFTTSRAIRTSTANDRVRKLFYESTKGHVTLLDHLYKYGKLKSWEAEPPAYKSSKPQDKENIDMGAAYHLWDHLNARYDQMELTHIFLGFVHDLDLKVVFELGMAAIKKQIEMIEKLCMDNEVPCPDRPATITKVSIDPEILNDKFMYRNTLNGVQQAIDLHLRAVVEMIKNDEIRKTFYELFIQEIDIYDKYLKYGKMKGWTKLPPVYTIPT